MTVREDIWAALKPLALPAWGHPNSKGLCLRLGVQSRQGPGSKPPVQFIIREPGPHQRGGALEWCQQSGMNSQQQPGKPRHSSKEMQF